MFRYISRVFARQVIRRIAIIAVGALFMLLPALWGGLQAHAATEYDDHIKYVDNLDNFKPCSQRELSFDMTYSWGDPVVSRLQDLTTNGSTQQIRDDAAEALEWFQSGSGYWVTRSAINAGNINVYIAHPDSTFSFGHKGQWVASGTTVHAHGLNVSGSPYFYVLTFTSMNANVNNCSNTNYPEDKDEYLDMLINGIGSGSEIGKLDFYKSTTQMPAQYSAQWPNYIGTYWQTYPGLTPDRQEAFHLIASDNVTYPEGYEGDIIPDTGPAPPIPPVTGERFAPDWIVLSASDWNAEIRDKRFFTFDGIFWTCSVDGTNLVDDDSGITPGIDWELWSDDNNVIIDSGTIGAGAMWSYQFPKHEVERNYRLKGRYFCGADEGITPIYFDVIGEKEFIISATGVLQEQDFFSDCFSEEFPFIHINACVNNLAAVINALSFGVIKVNGFDSSDNCRQLQVLGNWINKPGQTICPQFPEHVRNVVTPFVMFILGIFTAIFVVSYINKRGIN